jgi:hypothetical protein
MLNINTKQLRRQINRLEPYREILSQSGYLRNQPRVILLQRLEVIIRIYNMNSVDLNMDNLYDILRKTNIPDDFVLIFDRPYKIIHPANCLHRFEEELEVFRIDLYLQVYNEISRKKASLDHIELVWTTVPSLIVSVLSVLFSIAAFILSLVYKK